MSTLFESDLRSLERLRQGKVRDIYAVDDDHLLIVASDRMSAFDVVLPTPIPDKGGILTRMSNFWFSRTDAVVPNHLSDVQVDEVLSPEEVAQVGDRAVVVRRLQPLPVEAIVRGYITGSAWSEYKRQGTVCGMPMPAGLCESEQFPEPIFTPSTKAPEGEHDLNISFDEMCGVLGGDTSLAERIRDASLRVYREAAAYALERGIIIADTKFELALMDGELYLIDEILTPDSSRFWPLDQYEAGRGQPSFDKQYVRDYLSSTGWDKAPPAPELPPEIVAQTAEKYHDALRLLTG